jgi:8-oxo-dGTP pyrophosphatase MutT (NUDIX family)
VFVTDDMIAAMAAQFGSPARRAFHFEVTRREYDRIRSSQKHGRNHDATLYVLKDDRVVVIAKHFYPPGLYRAPSGGLHPGESFADGIAREMREEIGCVIGLDRFLMQTEASFAVDSDVLKWRSFVFLAHYVSGDFAYTDKDEIREVRLADWCEFTEYGRIMRTLDIGGLHYRAALHEAAVDLMDGARR